MIPFGKPSGTSSSFGNNCVVTNPMPVTFLDGIRTTESGPNGHTWKPIVEEPKSPIHEQDIEDFRGMNVLKMKKSPLSNSIMKSSIQMGKDSIVHTAVIRHKL